MREKRKKGEIERERKRDKENYFFCKKMVKDKEKLSILIIF